MVTGPVLPSASWWWPLLCLGCALGLLAWAGWLVCRAGVLCLPVTRLSATVLGIAACTLLSFCLGLARSLEVGQRVVDGRVPHCADLAVFTLDVVVVPPVSVDGVRQRFLADTVSSSAIGDCRLRVGTRLRLTLQDGAPVAGNASLTMTAKLRRPVGMRNLAGFDAERWLFAEGVHGTGFVVSLGSAPDVDRLAPSANASVRLRHRLQQLGLLHPGVVLALGGADPGLLTSEAWRVFRGSGTVHLMVISGLHIGIVWGVMGLVFRALLIVLASAGVGVRDQRSAAALLALLCSGGLVLASGAGPPAMRAWFMLAMAVLAGVASRRIDPVSGLLLAFAVVTAVDPLSVLTPGLWLSFAAVAALLLAFRPGARPRSGAVAAFALAQLVMALVLAPLVSLFNGVWVWQSAFANLLVVPLVSALVVPLALLGCLLLLAGVPCAETVLRLADGVTHLVFYVLDAAASVPAVLTPTGRLGESLLACLCGLLLCLPVHHWLRLAMVSTLLLPMLGRPSDLGSGEFGLRVLDVGQGSAAIIDTERRRLIVDAGNRSRSGFDLGSAVVVPNFLATGQRRLDALILSHGDLDHSGGADSVRRDLGPQRVLVGPGLDAGLSRCEPGESWQWDGVRFSVLSARFGRGSDNDGSCVLRVDGRSGSALLPGDIEARSEYRLTLAGLAPVDVLVAPHHGSQTSSSKRFIAALEPIEIMVSAGRGNRFGHPHPSVLERYRAAGARVWRTDVDGALSWRSDRRDVQAMRAGYQPYWRAVRPPSSR